MTLASSQPAVALIMRSKNEMPYTRDVFEALERQTYRNYVLYNVDSGSTDDTLKVVRQHNPNPANIVEIAPEDYVPGKVLNMMIKAAHEPLIVLLNADAIPLDDQWLEKLLEPLLQGAADGAISRQVARSDAHFIVKEDYSRAYAMERFPNGVLVNFFSAVACAFRREIWDETKFYTGGYAEDLAWCQECQAKGRRFVFVADSVVEHSHNYTLKGLYRKRFRQGVTFGTISGMAPSALGRLYQAGKEMLRDTYCAIKHCAPQTIPYNIIYRSLIHLAYYQGIKEGLRRTKNK